MPRFYKERKPFILKDERFLFVVPLLFPPAKRSGHSKSDNGLTAAIYLKFSQPQNHGRPSPRKYPRGLPASGTPSIGFPWLLLPFIVSTKYLFPIIPVFFVFVKSYSALSSLPDPSWEHRQRAPPNRRLRSFSDLQRRWPPGFCIIFPRVKGGGFSTKNFRIAPVPLSGYRYRR